MHVCLFAYAVSTLLFMLYVFEITQQWLAVTQTNKKRKEEKRMGGVRYSDEDMRESII